MTNYIRRNRGGSVSVVVGGHHAEITGRNGRYRVMRSGCQIPAALAAEELAEKLLASLGDPYGWQLVPNGEKNCYHIPR